MFLIGKSKADSSAILRSGRGGWGNGIVQSSRASADRVYRNTVTAIVLGEG